MGQHGEYARNTPGSSCQYKEDDLVSRPPTLFTAALVDLRVVQPVMPKVLTQVTMFVTAKFGSFFEHVETGEIRQNVISSSVQHLISLIFAIHVSFIIPLPMMWILLTKLIQKSVTTVCLHCSLAILKNFNFSI